jgi:hypothetical protein
MNKNKTIKLAWYDPRNGEIFPAGFAVFNENKGDYFLKIFEESEKRHFYLKPSEYSDGTTRYRMEMVLLDSNNKPTKRRFVGIGESTPYTNKNIHINYGSKYKILVLFAGGSNNE